MNIDATLAKLDALCDRVEETLAELQKLASAKRNPYAEVRERHPNAGKPWNAQDDEELRRLYNAGNSVDDLALLFGRRPNGIRLRLVKLGLTEAAPTAV